MSPSSLTKTNGSKLANGREATNGIASALPLTGWQFSSVTSQASGPHDGAERSRRAFERRVAMARAQAAQVHPIHANNGDDDRYGDRRASFTKGLAHDPVTGLANQLSYDKLLTALGSGVPEHFEQIPMAGMRKLVNPQAGLAYETEGADSHALTAPPASRFASDEIAAEIVENYWMALLRDVHFDHYELSSTASDTATDAAAELTSFGNDFKGAKDFVGGTLQVTPATLFRGLTPGDKAGPYISQFLMRKVPFGAQGYDQRMRTPEAGKDYVTSWQQYVAIQNGLNAGFNYDDLPLGDMEQHPVYIRNGRDLGQWVHVDVLFQAYFNAMLLLLQDTDQTSPVGGGLGIRFDAGNPYHNSLTQEAFGTFGGPYIAATLCEVATRALKAVWFQKWYVHRRLRPEAFAARIHTNRMGITNFDLSSKATGAAVLDRIAMHNMEQNMAEHGGEETYLLPLAFPEGSPMHPSYGAGHGTVAGACVTVLKAFFDEDAEILNPTRVSGDGMALEPYTGARLYVGGELNKLASNIALGRNMAGVHWRSDGTESLLLGEQVAISLLRDHRQMFNERFGGYALTSFSGHKLRV